MCSLWRFVPVTSRPPSYGSKPWSTEALTAYLSRVPRFVSCGTGFTFSLVLWVCVLDAPQRGAGCHGKVAGMQESTQTDHKHPQHQSHRAALHIHSTPAGRSQRICGGSSSLSCLSFLRFQYPEQQAKTGRGSVGVGRWPEVRLLRVPGSSR